MLKRFTKRRTDESAKVLNYYKNVKKAVEVLENIIK